MRTVPSHQERPSLPSPPAALPNSLEKRTKYLTSLQNPESWKGFLWGGSEIISVMPAGFLCLGCRKACRRMNRINKNTKNVSFPLKRDVLGTNGKPVLDIFILSSFKQTSPSANIGSCAQRVDICEQKQPISGAPGLRMWVTRLLIHSLTLWYHSAFLLHRPDLHQLNARKHRSVLVH